ncbi:fumarylacetoacetate hydrolase family protein [Thalassobacillus pellis]|uniref:fumarylacetoacetate hydrolase family protein n=1 Tax=Thalassobacillus pellis TaxID=748008 RepID=UPI0019616F04|nr:fumarylacetoacetate hydrolase family protein [Thalassobacillus pellis]MBM7551889.1 2-keto-4-pentenoate hydratase/2-oxohepta-3-ene-1,7-dioic acid hydratase in catechol pathway [Thalassobacillus pellis]
MTEIRNIFCVGRNYAAHAKELQNEVPEQPMIFSKPTHAFIHANGNSITIPKDRGEVHYETELVIRIGKSFQDGMRAEEVIEQMAIGLDLTLRDVQNSLKEKGHPWLLAKGFPNAAVISDFIPFEGIEACKRNNFSLWKNNEQVQSGNIRLMIFDFQTIIEYCASNLGLGEGDIIFTGTPEGVGTITPGDQVEMLWGNKILGSCTFS